MLLTSLYLQELFLQFLNGLLKKNLTWTPTILKQLNGTFHFVLILVIPVDKGSSGSPNIRLHFIPQLRRRTFSQRMKQVDFTQSEPQFVSSDVTKKSDPVAGIKNNY